MKERKEERKGEIKGETRGSVWKEEGNGGGKKGKTREKKLYGEGGWREIERERMEER